jgi:hypothetical protein
MAGVGEELELVAMKAVAIVGEEMDEGDGGCDGEDDCEVDSAAAGDRILMGSSGRQ